jgi:hypothetical protein
VASLRRGQVSDRCHGEGKREDGMEKRTRPLGRRFRLDRPAYFPVSIQARIARLYSQLSQIASMCLPANAILIAEPKGLINARMFCRRRFESTHCRLHDALSFV